MLHNLSLDLPWYESVAKYPIVQIPLSPNDALGAPFAAHTAWCPPPIVPPVVLFVCLYARPYKFPKLAPVEEFL